jgi:hypothetical protein
MLPPAEDGGRSADDAVIVRPGVGERYERSNRTISILGGEPRFSALEIAFDESFHVDPHEPGARVALRSAGRTTSSSARTSNVTGAIG